MPRAYEINWLEEELELYNIYLLCKCAPMNGGCSRNKVVVVVVTMW